MQVEKAVFGMWHRSNKALKQKIQNMTPDTSAVNVHNFFRAAIDKATVSLDQKRFLYQKSFVMTT